MYVCTQIRRTYGLRQWANYSTFSVSNETANYRLMVAGYSGDAGDGLGTNHHNYWNANGKPFSTPDIDNYPRAKFGSCSSETSGWWFGFCTLNVLNNDFTGIWSKHIKGPPPMRPLRDVTASRMWVKVNH